MKLFRHGPKGQERPGLVDARGVHRDLGDLIGDIDGPLLAHELAMLRTVDAALLPPVALATRFGPPLTGVGKFVCIGLNYKDHAAESGMELPQEPILFMKATSAICGPDDDIEIPPGAGKVDWEVELGVVIGRGGRYLCEADALSHVAGVLIVNDLSERSFQLERGGQWDKGKGCDTFGPIGPYLVTLDEVVDLAALELRLDVNGRRMQAGSTRDMVFGVAHLVAYVSQFMSLQPGDIISTGTPAGVGLGRDPPVWLQPGDEVVVEITGLGRQRQRLVASAALEPRLSAGAPADVRA